jgi:hypothetical protein
LEFGSLLMENGTGQAEARDLVRRYGAALPVHSPADGGLLAALRSFTLH